MLPSLRAVRAIPKVARPFSKLAVTSSTSGEALTTSFRINFSDDNGAAISPWHDIPLRDGDLFNFISEIPKFTKAKMEVATTKENNPICQDLKNGKLRDYVGPIFWNYGCLPQTWEDPSVTHPEVGYCGDNDPLDVVEIGTAALKAGSVTKVKVLGILAMIDDGELDWKVIAIDSNDPFASQFNDIDDVNSKCPEVVSGIREWFRWYKTPDNKPLNKFGFNEVVLPKKRALEVIDETHQHWRNLIAGKCEAGKIWTGRT